MSSVGYKEFQFKETAGTKEFSLRGFKVKSDEFNVGSYSENSDFKADPIDHPFRKLGLEVSVTELVNWAKDNGYDLFEQGSDNQNPYVLSTTINAGKTVLSVSFNQDISLEAENNAALKAGITIATDGETFGALQVADTVEITDGNIVITFDSALTTSTNKISIAPNMVKDVAGNTNEQVTLGPIDVAAPTLIFSPADSDTGVPIDTQIVISSNKKLFHGSDGAEIYDNQLDSIIELKETNDSGSVVAFTGKVNANRTQITITPNVNLSNNQVYYVEVIVDSVRDVSGNKVSETSITFTTVA